MKKYIQYIVFITIILSSRNTLNNTLANAYYNFKSASFAVQLGFAYGSFCTANHLMQHIVNIIHLVNKRSNYQVSYKDSQNTKNESTCKWSVKTLLFTEAAVIGNVALVVGIFNHFTR